MNSRLIELSILLAASKSTLIFVKKNLKHERTKIPKKSSYIRTRMNTAQVPCNHGQGGKG